MARDGAPRKGPLEVVALTPERFLDFLKLCAAMGPNRSCYCMWWRDEAPRSEPRARERARDLVATCEHPVGLLAYRDDLPVGWVALSPRAHYPRLNRGHTTAPEEGSDHAWALPCFFVLEEERHTGVASALLEGAVALATRLGARILEGVPVDPATKARSASASYTGTVPMFAAAGFVEVARRSPTGRVLMRLLREEGPR